MLKLFFALSLPLRLEQRGKVLICFAQHQIIYIKDTFLVHNVKGKFHFLEIYKFKSERAWLEPGKFIGPERLRVSRINFPFKTLFSREAIFRSVTV